jgi:uncharacterized SAM-binding protein YcdF (DUF218 family)
MYQLLLRLLHPFPWLLIAVGFGLWRLHRRDPEHRRTWRWTWLAYALLVLDCLPITAYFTAGLLEWQYPRRYDLPADTQVIVVLGGGVLAAAEPGDRDRLAESSFVRAQFAAELYHDGPRCLVLVSGGHPQPNSQIASPAGLMAESLLAAGVDPSDLMIEDRSRNTAENAAATVALLKARGLTDGVVLVSGASHLPRAERLFRRLGCPVTPIGCAYRTDECRPGVWAFWPKSSAATINQEMVHEALGMAWYWLRGKL